MASTPLQKMYEAAYRTDDLAAHQNFIGRLIGFDAADALAWHYELLRARNNRDLYLRLRAAFAKRDQTAADFLLAQLSHERDRVMRLDVLHLLGRMRAPAGLDLARRWVGDDDSEFRERACYVVGWMGAARDVEATLGPRLLEDPSPMVRRTASTALSQITDRIARARPSALRLLHRALREETEQSVVPWLVVTVQRITKKRFGLKEDLDENEVRGDVAAAHEKCLAFLSRGKG